MPSTEKLRLNFFVGALLAQGGEVWFDGQKLVFSPTSAIDRAMGATDVVIPLTDIRGLEQGNQWSRTVRVKTDKSTYKFEGGQAQRLAELLENSLKENGLTAGIKLEKKNEPPPAPAPSSSVSFLCLHCTKTLHPTFAFCPYCGTRVKPE